MPFFGTTWVSRHWKDKQFWILMKQQMMDQLDCIQIICTSLQTDNHASTSPLSFLQTGCPSCRPTNSIKALKHCILSNALRVEIVKQLPKMMF